MFYQILPIGLSTNPPFSRGSSNTLVEPNFIEERKEKKIEKQIVYFCEGKKGKTKEIFPCLSIRQKSNVAGRVVNVGRSLLNFNELSEIQERPPSLGSLFLSLSLSLSIRNEI